MIPRTSHSVSEVYAPRLLDQSKMNLPRAHWAQLRQAHGDCSHVPMALRGLMSADATTREKARWKIDNHVVKQGDLYGGAPWVAEALVKLLQVANDPARVLLYDLLTELLLGFAPDTDVVRINDQVFTLREATGAVVATGREQYERDARRHENTLVQTMASDLVQELDDRGL